jgi:hypothetical protein
MGRQTNIQAASTVSFDMNKKFSILLFALAWAGATYFIVDKFTDKITDIAVAAADQAALKAASRIKPEIDKMCNQIMQLQPSYDADPPSTLCNVVATLSE